MHVYLRRSRVDAAKLLLRDTYWRTLEISRAVGYRSKTSLSGLPPDHWHTPDEYRRRWHLVPINHSVAELLNLDRYCQI